MLEVLGKIGFDWQVALANLVNFIIIFFLLRKFAWGPIQKVIAERQRKIDQGLEDAEKAKGDLVMAEEIKNKKIEEARMDANQIIGSAQEKADGLLASSKEEALTVRTNIIKDGEKIAADKKNQVSAEVEKEMSALIIQGVTKVLKENMTKEMQENYIKKSLNSFGSQKSN